MNDELKGIRIALVEDEFLIAEELAEVLADAGAHIVGPFSSLQKALTMAADEQLDIALLDVNLAGEPIFPAALALLQRGIPFVFMTGYAADSMPPEFRSHPIVRKPFQTDDLIKLIATVAKSAVRPRPS